MTQATLIHSVWCTQERPMRPADGPPVARLDSDLATTRRDAIKRS